MPGDNLTEVGAMRIAYVFVPHFPVAVEVRERPGIVDQPIVVGGAPEERKAVVDCSPEALRRGVRRDMSLREALSRCPEAVFLEARHVLYRDVSTAIADAIETVSPLVEPHGEAVGSGRFFVGLTGLLALHGNETRLAQSLARAVTAAVRLTPLVGIADGKFAAYASALISTPNQPRIIAPGKTADFLAPLAIDHLPVSAAMHRRLHLLGIHRMGELAALPLAAVQAQFGPEGQVAWNLINGVDETVVTARPQPVILVERMQLPAPVANAHILLIAAKHLLARLLSRPECQYRAARGLTFRAALANGQIWERVLVFREPRGDVDSILTALRGKIVDADITASVEEIELALSDWCDHASTPNQLFPSQRARQQIRIEEAVRQLTSRYGRTPIARIVEVEPWSRIPERRFALIDYDA